VLEIYKGQLQRVKEMEWLGKVDELVRFTRRVLGRVGRVERLAVEETRGQGSGGVGRLRRWSREKLVVNLRASDLANRACGINKESS